uniref:Uncharacterized protein n=1 Tax=viral metagenome TaxID=1070528 RepID=A0A6C0DS93_9ZZZZ
MALPPDRSSFCYINSSKFISDRDNIANKQNWATFERVENNNSAILLRLANTVPTGGVANGSDRIWYQFADDAEKIAYRQGRRDHIAAFPTVSDFTIPYSDRPIPYTSTVLSTLASLPQPAVPINCICSLPTGRLISDDERISNAKGASVYVKASTQTALYPKSPYRFSSADEYLLYKRYVSMNNVRTDL